MNIKKFEYWCKYYSYDFSYTNIDPIVKHNDLYTDHVLTYSLYSLEYNLYYFGNLSGIIQFINIIDIEDIFYE